MTMIEVPMGVVTLFMVGAALHLPGDLAGAIALWNEFR